jgi:hypothetical protein
VLKIKKKEISTNFFRKLCIKNLSKLNVCCIWSSRKPTFFSLKKNNTCLDSIKLKNLKKKNKEKKKKLNFLNENALGRSSTLVFVCDFLWRTNRINLK